MYYEEPDALPDDMNERRKANVPDDVGANNATRILYAVTTDAPGVALVLY